MLKQKEMDALMLLVKSVSAMCLWWRRHQVMSIFLCLAMSAGPAVQHGNYRFTVHINYSCLFGTCYNYPKFVSFWHSHSSCDSLA